MLRQAREKRPAGGGERPDEAEAREEPGAPPRLGRAGEQRLLERQEEADVARRRVDRSDRGDDEERPEPGRDRDRGAGERHQHRAGEEQRTRLQPMRQEADRERRGGRAEEGRGRDRADFGRPEPALRQVDGEEKADEAVAEAAHAARRENEARSALHGPSSRLSPWEFAARHRPRKGTASRRPSG